MRLDINLQGARRKLSDQAVIRGRRASANQAAADMNPFIPFKEGPLRQQMTVASDGSSINYHAKYAGVLFYMQMYNYTTPGTGPRWDMKAKPIFISDWINAFKRGAGW
ncbi:minor capsid protein [Alkalihalobacillus hemicellulosilyticus]|uniref:Phage minor capsid protein n=1 Tax=Halalkalibacter hemicellulosilyticusJCM 9152 TaxID=1236971 RepID=W4QK14_9BACI|nr:minor capsid protein [Halalkalibacter hemicellulosilyticus]GAE32445.1 phage minor capsid protein [Halalkalibacter hemicellulosilyticusJCM 9152]